MDEDGEFGIDYDGMNETPTEFLERDFDLDSVNLRTVGREIAALRELVDDRMLAMLDQDVGNGRKLGSSRTFLKAGWDVVQQLRAKHAELEESGNVLTPELRRRLDGEAKTALERAFMHARAEFIKRSRMSLPGW